MNIANQIVQVKIENIVPNRYQPRQKFNEQDLIELSNSIRQYGIIQPLTLRQFDTKYEIIAGERRYRAAIMSGLQTVPAIIMNVNDQTSAELAIVENIQRKNLNAIEEAEAYKKILELENITQEELARKIGKSQATISNKLKLLDLAKEVRDAVLNNDISERHARVLLKLNNYEHQKEVLNKILTEKLTVKLTDDLILNNYGIQENFIKKIENEDEINNKTGDDIEMNEQNYNTLMNQQVGTIPETPLPQQPAPQQQNNSLFNNNFFPSLEDEKTNMELNPWAVPQQDVTQNQNGQLPETPNIQSNPLPEPSVNPWEVPASNSNFVQPVDIPMNNQSIGSVAPSEVTQTMEQPVLGSTVEQQQFQNNNQTTGFNNPEQNNSLFNNNINSGLDFGSNNSQQVPMMDSNPSGSFDNPMFGTNSPQPDLTQNNVTQMQNQQVMTENIPNGMQMNNQVPGFIDQASMNMNQQPKTNINELISKVRQSITEIDQTGTKIQTSELDLDTEYQIIIRIQKESN